MSELKGMWKEAAFAEALPLDQFSLFVSSVVLAKTE
jgi:hypothetical protein